MVVYQTEVDLLFHALADATRRDIVRRTMDDSFSVSTLARDYPMSFAAVQKHVAVLERAGLVTKQRRGREHLVAGNPAALRAAHDALDRLELVWRERVARMDDLLATDPSD
ncbi:MAG: ArsR/SmtB family transcription factor [Longimicrobiaceae bacterium]